MIVPCRSCGKYPFHDDNDIENNHYSWCPLRSGSLHDTLMTEESLTGQTCLVCGFSDGAHGKECIDALVTAGNATLARTLNKLYNHVDLICKSKCINFPQTSEILESVKRDTAHLRAAYQSFGISRSSGEAADKKAAVSS